MNVVDEIRQNREKGAKRLESEYKAGLMALASRFCNDSSDAEELVNATFATVVEKIDDYLEQSAFFGWMCQILMSHLSRSIRRKSNESIVYPGDLPDVDDQEAHEEVYRNLDRSLVRDALQKLEPEDREVLLMHYFLDIPVVKIARILMIPSGTVKSRLHYARRALAAKMGAAVKKKGGKALLLALALACIAALGALAYNLVFNLSTSNGESMNQTTKTTTTRAAAMLAAAMAATTAQSDTLYWTGGASGTWGDSTACWTNSASSTPRPWQDGSDAVFAKDVSGDHTVTVTGNRTANGISGGGSSYTFKGSGTISWTDWFARTANTTFNVPLTDNGGGLRFDAKGFIYFKKENTHTGGTWVKGSSSSLNPFAITIGDKAFGAVPVEKQTNIVWQGGNVALYAENGAKSLHANRTIRVVDGATFWIATGDPIAIKGDIVGDINATYGLPSGTRIQVGRDASTWTGLAKLSGTNSVGQIKVLSQLEISGGRTSVAMGTAADNDNAPIYIVGNNSEYKTRVGRMLVSGGELVNSQSDARYFETQSYGQLDVAGGSVIATNVLFLNAYGSPGKVTVRDGGLLHCGTFRLSQTGTGTGGELFLCTNGVLRVNQIETKGSAGAIHFNGGRLQRTSSDGDAIANASGTTWNSISFLVEAGGAVFDTSNGNSISFPKALSSGVADGETDGGLTCILSGGNLVVLTAAGSTYNGPTRLEGPNGTLLCRTANVLPAGTTLQVGPGTTASFATAAQMDVAQTVARVEGTGSIDNNSLLTVTRSITPKFDDTYGTLTFVKTCSLSGVVLEITGDASGCGCVKFAPGQDISGLSLSVADMSAFSKEMPSTTYKIVENYSGRFASANLPAGWKVRYKGDAIYLRHSSAFMVVVR